VRAALLAGVGLGALAVLAPDGAYAVDGTWLGGQPPSVTEWNQGSNWSSNPAVPDDIATFTSGVNTTVTNFGSAAINTIQFDSTAPAYSFTNFGFFTINGAGIVNNSASAQSFTNNAFIQFSNASTAANAAITNNGALTFVDTSSAGSALISNSGGLSLISFTDNSTAGNATILTLSLAKTQFASNSTGGNAQLIAAGGIFDFSLSSGPAGDNKLSAGSIAGIGAYFLGANQLTVGGNNLSTTVNGVISDCGLGGSECNNLGAAGGALVKVGAGTLTLTGANTYTGGTTISGGALQLGNGGASGSILGDVVDNGIFAINRSDTFTFSGVISGTGAFMQLGPGTTVLTGTNTYTGATNVNAGTLQAGAANAFSPFSAFSVASGATLDFNSFNQTIGSLAGAGNVTLGAATLTAGNDNTSTTFSGAISGTGGLTKTGSGTLLLTGISSYTGATTVNAGTLSVNGSIANSALTVNAGGAIGGIGTIGNTTINGGTLSPGNSIGTLTVQGNLVLTAAAAYLVEVSPAAADRTNVTGTASLAGSVQAVFGPGAYIARSYTILSAAGGLGGTRFNSLITANLPANFATSLSYTPTDVLLNLTAVLGAGTGLSQNQRNVAGALNDFFNNGGALPPGFVSVFGLTGGNLANALSQLSGEAATGGQQVAFQMTNQFLGLMLDPFVDGRSGVAGAGGPALGFAPAREDLPDDIALAYSSVLKAPPAKAPSFEQRWSVWGGAYGGSNRTSGDPAVVGSHDLSARAAGFAAGLDYRLTPNTVVGMALAGGGTNWSLANGLGGGKSDAFQAGVYGATRWGPAYLAAAFSYTNHWMSTDRFAFAGNHLTASFNAPSLGARVESGYRFATIVGGLTPYAAIQAQNFRTPSYSETDLNGGGFALAYNSRTGTDTRSELGARFDRLLAVNPNAVLTLRARLAWAHDWVSDPTLAAVFQALPGASFVVNGAAPAKDSALASAGTELRLANGVSLLGKFDGEFASRSSTYAGTGTVRYAW
jgi:autotransporter-associated beta strand protein